MTPEEHTQQQAEVKKRQKNRNLVMGGLLLFFVFLFYAITIVRMGD